MSAAIIAKNEEQVVGRCLEAVSRFADEIVFVDTGSTDRTKDVASGFEKVRLYDSEKFDKDTHYSDFEFGVAKNEAIRKCSGDWIVWWDADDFVDEKNAARILELAQMPPDRLLSFTVAYGSLRFPHVRMLPGGKGVLFDETHACHEFLLTMGLATERVDVTLQHLPGRKEVPSVVRNLAILEKDYFARGRRDVRTVFYLANSYRESGRREDAVKMYDEYLTKSKWAEERFFARYYKAQMFDRMDRRPEARRELFMAMGEDVRFAEPLCMLGDMAMGDGDSGTAELWYRMALRTVFPAEAQLFVSKAMYDDYPKRRLQDIDRLRGDEQRNVEPVALEVKVEEKKPDRPVVRKKVRTYLLPKDREMAAFAMAALEACARENPDTGFEVLTEEDWQEEMVKASKRVGIGIEGAVPLSCPVDRKGKHAIEWFCRSAGYVGVKWNP